VTCVFLKCGANIGKILAFLQNVLRKFMGFAKNNAGDFVFNGKIYNNKLLKSQQVSEKKGKPAKSRLADVVLILLNTPLKRGVILMDFNVSEEFLLYEISTLLQQDVSNRPQIPLSFRFTPCNIFNKSTFFICRRLLPGVKRGSQRAGLSPF